MKKAAKPSIKGDSTIKPHTINFGINTASCRLVEVSEISGISSSNKKTRTIK